MTSPPVTFYTTAELAREAGVTRRTVMHYAELGLLTPDQVTASGRALYGPYALRLLRDVMDLRALGVPLDEARDMVILRRATHTLDGTYRRDWTRADIPLSDERLRVIHARLRLLQGAYARQAEGIARFDRWLTKRLTGGNVEPLGLEELEPEEGEE
ncbi:MULTISPECIES: MerR family transcriptional regulator [Deinococcus]|uniref:Transcriptional regulator, MerR family n=1 Tax=Deinococcus geothermalis (strain DSM 11300 / CIP 105573 / AG-3a) TaxID=319795 RepID=Q1J3U3_DEIGD|nr:MULTISPECIES: MerR family transcriptional regulator [Deinococcus]ABF43841.1 transcriptional regulator, MerR family [Deinococcus geothermalis DSM 11300]TDE85275.1 MerR family transcriptional regulator [Deinococcus sp. S9]